MVLDANFERTIHKVSIEDVYKSIHAKPDFTRAYLERLDATQISVSEWEDNGAARGCTRTIAYRVKLKLPAISRPLMPSDTLYMNEVQTLLWTPNDADADSNEGATRYQIYCEPAPQVPGKERFQTPTSFDVKQVGEDVVVTCTVSCTSAIWGIGNQIEKVILTEAQRTLTVLMDRIVTWCSRELSDRAESEADSGTTQADDTLASSFATTAPDSSSSPPMSVTEPVSTAVQASTPKKTTPTAPHRSGIFGSSVSNVSRWSLFGGDSQDRSKADNTCIESSDCSYEDALSTADSPQILSLLRQLQHSAAKGVAETRELAEHVSSLHAAIQRLQLQENNSESTCRPWPSKAQPASDANALFICAAAFAGFCVGASLAMSSLLLVLHMNAR